MIVGNNSKCNNEGHVVTGPCVNKVTGPCVNNKCQVVISFSQVRTYLNKFELDN